MHVKNKNVDIVPAIKAVEELFKSLNIKLPIETPERFVKMRCYLTKYQNISNKEIAKELNKVFEVNSPTNSKNMVIVKDIDVFSLCEHHIALMYDMKISVAYIPNGFAIGLSKIVRLVDMICKRLQLQEKIGNDILETMGILLKNQDIAVHIKAKHSCVTARGIKNVFAETVTTHFSGAFLEDEKLKTSFANSLK